VALAKRRGVCPACEKATGREEIEKMREVALEADRARYRASQLEQV